MKRKVNGILKPDLRKKANLEMKEVQVNCVHRGSYKRGKIIANPLEIAFEVIGNPVCRLRK